MHQFFGIDVLQHRHGETVTGGFHVIDFLVLAVRRQQQADTFTVVRQGERYLLRTTGRHGDELATDVDLVGQQVGNPRIGRLHHVLNLGRIVEQTLGDHVPDIDIEPLQLAVRALEVPRSVSAAGAYDQFAAGQNAIELAVRRLGYTHGSGRSREQKNTRFEQGRSAMHGKHSRVMFIPLYRNMVCNNGIDSRKCATGCGGNVSEIEICFESEGCVRRGKNVTKRTEP
ncbi:hypothetical protein D3C85_1158120 [compost metagenome]